LAFSPRTQASSEPETIIAGGGTTKIKNEYLDRFADAIECHGPGR
jgi:hypothetical protein